MLCSDELWVIRITLICCKASASKNLFEKLGFLIVDYSVDFKVDKVGIRTLMDYLPDADSFQLLNTAYRELIGRFIYLLV